MRLLPFKKIYPLVIWFAVILSVNLVGVIGFMVVEKLSFFDALYMTIITITTIGYGEVKTLSYQGRVFNIIFIITSFDDSGFPAITGASYYGPVQIEELYLSPDGSINSTGSLTMNINNSFTIPVAMEALTGSSKTVNELDVSVLPYSLTANPFTAIPWSGKGTITYMSVIFNETTNYGE